MFNGGYINQKGEYQKGDRERSPYHNLLEYIISEGDAPLSTYYHGVKTILTPEKLSALQKDRNISILLSKEEKRELYGYLRFAYSDQVLHILQSKTPRTFVYHAAEVIGAIQKSKAFPLPLASKNHTNYKETRKPSLEANQKT